MLIPLKTFSLTRFPVGICNLEGLLVKATNEKNWYFIVNHSSNSETRFRLSAYIPTEEINENGQFVKAVLYIPHETFSLYGEAELKKIESFINPYIDPKYYRHEAEVWSVCKLDRYPNSMSIRKPKK